MRDKLAWLTMVVLGVIALASGVRCAEPIAEPPFTQNLTQFKQKKHFNARSQKLLACWLYLREETHREGAKQYEEHEWLHLMKQCMKKITRKDSVLKITQLGKRNMQPVTPFSQILNPASQLSTPLTPTENSQFDLYLLSRSEDFTKQLSQIFQKGNIDAQIEQELKRRQKYYFGIIPSSMVNHTTILVTMTMLMMCCCTWFRLYRGSAEKVEEKRGKRMREREGEQESQSMIKATKIKTKKSKNK